MGKRALATRIIHLPSMYLSALGVDSLVVFESHWLVSAGSHVDCAPHFKGHYTSNERPRFLGNLPCEIPGQPELGQLLARVCSEHGARTWPTTHHLGARLRHPGADAPDEPRPALHGRLGVWVALSTLSRSQPASKTTSPPVLQSGAVPAGEVRGEKGRLNDLS